MTIDETESLLRYIITMYPNVRKTEREFRDCVDVWFAEFKDETRDTVLQAFKAARTGKPEWMPTVPMIQCAISEIKSRICVKSKEQEFRDSHCGKSKEEWDRMVAWEKSPDGNRTISLYKEKLSKIFGGRT